MEKPGLFCHNETAGTNFSQAKLGKGERVDKTKKIKPSFDFPIGLKKMSEEEAKQEMEKFWADLKAEFKDMPPEEIEASAKKIEAYLKGEASWADLMNLTPEMLYQMAEFGFAQFKMGRYQDAERVFKVLTVLDWDNGYYHSMMGSILQRQKRYGEAVAEYTEAIKLAEDDIVSYTHRGEIYLRHGLLEEAEKDLKLAVALDLTEENQWANRARILLAQMDKKKQ